MTFNWAARYVTFALRLCSLFDQTVVCLRPVRSVPEGQPKATEQLMIQALIIRGLFVLVGSLLLLVGVADLNALRARFVNSQPEAGTAVAAPPTAVTVSFSDELAPESRISV